MTVLLSGGGVQRGGAVPGREPVPVDEAVDVADVGQEPGRTGGADAVQVLKGRFAGDHEFLQFLLDGLDLLVEALELVDQLDHETAPGLAHDVSYTHLTLPTNRE